MLTAGMHSDAITSDQMRNELIAYFEVRLSLLRAERACRTLTKTEGRMFSVREHAMQNTVQFLRELHLPAPQPSDHDIAIGEHAFRAGFEAGQAYGEESSYTTNVESPDENRAWSEYMPPDELCGGVS